jgi:hypothetical protein
MQKVACPMIMVKSPVEIPKVLVKVLLSAIPVTIPGSEIGKTTSKDITSLPKKLYRATANARQVPKIRAIAVATRPAITDQVIASRTPVLEMALLHHIVVNSLGGQLKVFDALNEFKTTIKRGI